MSKPSVLCPIDFSSASLAALPIAAAEARMRNAMLDLLHVWQPGLEYAGEGPPIPFAAELPKEQIESDLASLEVDLPSDRIRIHVTSGQADQDIIDLATQLDCELLVMGTRAHHGLLSRWIIGSVCEHVLRHCPCPVLVCRGPEVGEE